MTQKEFFGGIKKHFPAIEYPGEYIDKTLWAFTGEYTIDVIAFDVWLHKQYGDYEDTKQSMSDIIKLKHGIDAEQFITESINL